METLWPVITIIIIYFLPAIGAYCGGHKNASAIFLTNLLFGWTLIGWGVALIWAATYQKKD